MGYLWVVLPHLAVVSYFPMSADMSGINAIKLCNFGLKPKDKCCIQGERPLLDSLIQCIFNQLRNFHIRIVEIWRSLSLKIWCFRKIGDHTLFIFTIYLFLGFICSYAGDLGQKYSHFKHHLFLFGCEHPIRHFFSSFVGIFPSNDLESAFLFLFGFFHLVCGGLVSCLLCVKSSHRSGVLC